MGNGIKVIERYELDKIEYYLEKKQVENGREIFIEGATLFHEPPRRGAISVGYLKDAGPYLEFAKGLSSPYAKNAPLLQTQTISNGFVGLDETDLGPLKKVVFDFFERTGNKGGIAVHYMVVDYLDSSPAFFGTLMAEALKHLEGP